MDIGRRIRGLRKDKGMTLTKLAEEIQISQPYLSQIERGDKQAPVDVIVKVCNVLGMPLSEFFADEQSQLPPDILQLIEAVKKLSPSERKYLNQFLRSTLERKEND